MICKNCGKEFSSLIFNTCPYCNYDYNQDDESYNPFFKPKKKDSYDPYDFNNPDNCSDKEYMDDEDYDDYDN